MHAKQGGARGLASVHDRLEGRDNRGARRAENDEIVPVSLWTWCPCLPSRNNLLAVGSFPEAAPRGKEPYLAPPTFLVASAFAIRQAKSGSYFPRPSFRSGSGSCIRVLSSRGVSIGLDNKPPKPALPTLPPLAARPVRAARVAEVPTPGAEAMAAATRFRRTPRPAGRTARPPSATTAPGIRGQASSRSRAAGIRRGKALAIGMHERQRHRATARRPGLEPRELRRRRGS